MANIFKKLFAATFLGCLAYLYFNDGMLIGNVIIYSERLAPLLDIKNVSNSIKNALFPKTLSHVNKEQVSKSSQNLPNLTSLARYIHFKVKTDITECGKRRYIVYTCSHWCGGWGDRLKGITSLFLLAQLTNRTLLIDMQTPCDLRNFVIPNIYDWSECLSTTKRIEKNKIIQLQYIDSMKSLHLNDFISGKFNKYQVIRIQTNAMAFDLIKKHPLTNSVIPWIHTLTIAEITGSVLGILFKPTKNITQEVKRFYRDKVGDKTLVCSHIRYGKNPSNPNDATFPDVDSRVSSVLQFLKRYDNKKNVIFVATDSDKVRNESRYLLSNYVSTDRQIVHIDMTRNRTHEPCQGFMAAILENVLLSKCDVLVLTKSGFGTMAAYMRGHSKNIYLHLAGSTEIANSSLSGIQQTYKFAR